MFWDNLVDRLWEFGTNLIEWLVLILIALLILVVGRWLAKWIARILGRLLDAKILDGLWERSGVSRALAEGEQTPGSIANTLIYAYLMIVVLLVAAQVVNLPVIVTLLIRLLAWIPLILLAAFIVIVFAAAGSWAASLVRPFAQERNIPWLTYLVHVGVIVFGLLFAMDIVNIGFAAELVMIILASGTIALAIAFGVGGIDAAKQWWAKYGTPSDGGGSGDGSSGGDSSY